MQTQRPFTYEGPEALYGPIAEALSRVVDPEFALNVVDIGLIYGVTVTDDKCRVRMTMTSAACPISGLLVNEVQDELERIAPPELAIEVEMIWEPPWTEKRMSEHARRFLGW